MTLAEFKAWLEGYSASFTDGAPNVDQWAVINDKLAGVDKPFRDLRAGQYGIHQQGANYIGFQGRAQNVQ